jgi:hypothetical protein
MRVPSAEQVHTAFVDALRGVDDPELAEEVAETRGADGILDDDIACLQRCTLTSFSLLRTGLGVELKFTMPLSEIDKLPAVSKALQRLVDISVTRHRRHRG